MPPRKTPVINEEFNTILAEYRLKYNVEQLDSPNDLANLHTMIRNQILISKLQAQLDTLTQNIDDFDPTQIKKILDSIVALSETNINYERTLGIDRKTRKQTDSENVADYLTGLKQRGKEWLDERIIKVRCEVCNILVGRISGVYDTTFYEGRFQCPQCKKQITIKREEQDVFFDVKDANWRRKYPIEIEAAKRTRAPDTSSIEDDIILGDGEE